MESSSSKVEAMKPIFLKAGIPLALSLAGFILARIAIRKSCLPTASSSQQSRIHADIQACERCEESFHSLEDDHTHEESYSNRNALESSLRVEESREVEEQILGLRRRIEEMQDREFQLEKQFLYYQELKDQEMELMEILNKIVLEMNRVEFLGREVSLLEAEIQRFESLAVDYLKVLRLVEFFASENEKLHKRVEKLWRKSKEHFRILRRQRMQIQCKETEISRNRKDLKLMNDENKELKLFIEQLQGKKDELKFKLRAAEESAKSKVEGETECTEDHNQIALKLEQIQKQEATEIQELIYLRRSNAWLRQELIKKKQEQEEAEENTEMDNNIVGIEEFGSDRQLNEGNGESELGLRTGNGGNSRRRKLIGKLKKWVEGENKCLPRHSVSEEAFLPARNSCSSV